LVLFAAVASAQEILVFAAASLTESIQEISKAFEAQAHLSPRFSFGASSDLARQIKAGAPADVFFSADTAKMDDLEKSGFIRREDRREFLSNVLVVIVPRESRATVSAASDMTKFSRLALADPAAVPAGIYSKKWLEGAGLWKELEPKVVPTLDVRAALAAVATGSVPAGVVYKTDAVISRDVRVAWTVTNGPEITYSLARVAKSSNAAAQRFVDFAAGPQARAVFEKYGFVVKATGSAAAR
jgi:molybdate transport system substrate-binding protein